MKKNKLLIGTAIACVALAVLIWFAFSQQSSSALTSPLESRQESGTKVADSQNEFTRQNMLNLSSSEKKKLSQQQIVFNEIEKDQLPSNVNFPLLKNAKGMIIKYDPNVIELKKVGDTVKFQMLEYGINRTGKIVEIEPVDQDIVRWTGKFDQGDPNQNFFTITQSQKDHYTIMQIFTEKGNYSAEIKDGVGLVQTMDEGVTDQELHHDHP
ncbi:metalloprotease secretion chaperone CpaB [Acinetobacter oleivorans]|uniref:metalloprotease secretion chaperone CpaB n=1 Tax=Acinetobacter oleivorans TaxID=1148157 RepID=UPI000E88A7C7|nr:metalloprotease secretion chaperone CpaB [Acinetobacter oleivorans]MBE2173559.1 metalloprotease secretion chaperone CpaB [Acinetobacter oleivorans]MDY7372099.1 metalloprotease secretion chaperone CpaB [Acinetobacter oleivorans]HBU86343.1 metalloprotease secretion chaperone CpaB [Acinetobacter sp.]